MAPDVGVRDLAEAVALYRRAGNKMWPGDLINLLLFLPNAKWKELLGEDFSEILNKWSRGHNRETLVNEIDDLLKKRSS